MKHVLITIGSSGSEHINRNMIPNGAMVMKVDLTGFIESELAVRRPQRINGNLDKSSQTILHINESENIMAVNGSITDCKININNRKRVNNYFSVENTPSLGTELQNRFPIDKRPPGDSKGLSPGSSSISKSENVFYVQKNINSSTISIDNTEEVHHYALSKDGQPFEVSLTLDQLSVGNLSIVENQKS
ncbi:uncharacterized protein LOC121378573 isoform X2 [Gigantopelta aegis]|uniref:uncharacterized protein LOC121378573 isoform X2 n=1 Tax=Gigantopelta aegis TaxID=1735272 RepID=UPI001B88DD9F|nr:uncharacterized protein LOC121378573 isoform X2 [Gigantopelta aegis]